MVRVLVVADEVAPALDHAALRRIGPDLVLAAGDLPWDYLEFVASGVDAPSVFVPGNHDAALEVAKRGRTGVYSRAGWFCDAPRPRGLLNADEQILDAGGLRIAGLGGCVRYRPGPHQYTQREYARKARRLARTAGRGRPVDVVLTHAPPFGLGDGEDRPHVGVQALHGVLEALKPSWLLHGHIHPYGRPTPDRQVGPTTVRNVIPWTVLDIMPRSDPEAGHPRTRHRTQTSR